MSEYKSNKGHGKKRKGQGSVPRNPSSIKPPQINTNVQMAHTYRYVSTGTFSSGITPAGLLLAAGSFGQVTNTLVSSAFQSVKVNKIEMWAPPPTQGSTTTVSVEWITSAAPGAGSQEVSDTSMSTAFPAYISAKPPRNSLCSFWQQSTSAGLFLLFAPAGTIIDIHLSLILADTGGATAHAAAATAALGVFYYMALDVGNGTHVLTPVSLNTTF
jgi:hypothetical protein